MNVSRERKSPYSIAFPRKKTLYTQAPLNAIHKMSSSLPPLHTLRAFEAIGRLRSFTLAAGELHLTHSAISHQMRALESSLQTSLIDRSRREIALTPQGQQFLAVVRPVLRQLTEIAETLRHAESRRLRINVLPSFAARWLLPRLGDFFVRHPDIDVEVAATQAVVDLNAAGAHLAIRYGDGQWPGTRCELLFDEALFPVASPAFIKRHRIRRLEDLKRVKLLRDDFHPWDAFLAAASQDASQCQFGPVYRDSALTLQAAESGQGVALARSWLAADALKGGSLSRIGSLSLPAQSAYFLVHPRDARVSAEVSEFVAWLRAQAELAQLY
ncbi:transcriptional regulator GcvA [Massilia sp. DD77]|uniref:transcriptional regulator GcvA n=1 Tax=Massilia sp. DD77 TaxID=3109349 RepID=UPI002FFE8750